MSATIAFEAPTARLPRVRLRVEIASLGAPSPRDYTATLYRFRPGMRRKGAPWVEVYQVTRSSSATEHARIRATRALLVGYGVKGGPGAWTRDGRAVELEDYQGATMGAEGWAL